jgi:hypothetical protein
VPCEDATTTSEDEVALNFVVRRVQARREERTVAGGDRAEAERGKGE